MIRFFIALSNHLCNDSLKEQKRDLIEQQAILKKMVGLLNTYTTAYNTVSRVVALRTYGTQI